MMCLNYKHTDNDPFPDWEIQLRDTFGRPGEPLGGVTGPVFTPEEALLAFLDSAPGLWIYPLIAVRSTIAPQWSMYEGA